jgi:hypothetical protein
VKRISEDTIGKMDRSTNHTVLTELAVWGMSDYDQASRTVLALEAAEKFTRLARLAQVGLSTDRKMLCNG